MALGKYYEDIVERRRENRAAVVFEYQHPQENAKQASPVPVPTPTAPKLRLFERIRVSVFSVKIQSDPKLVSRDLLAQTADWSLAHYEELGRKSPVALARLAMAYRDQVKRAKEVLHEAL